MQISFTHKDFLIAELKKAPIIIVSDQLEEIVNDEETETYELIPFKSMENIRFEKHNYEQYIINLKNKFFAEAKQNRYLENFDYSKYINDIKGEFAALKNKFGPIIINAIEYFWRKDIIIHYHFYPESEHTVIDLQSLDPKHHLFISEMVRFQYETIDRIINAPIKNFTTEINRKYNSTYLFDAFELSPGGKFTNRDIQQVYESLCSSGLVEMDRLIDFIKIFNKSCPFKKIKWTGKANELFFFFKFLVDEGILINPKRKLTQILLNSFCKSDGSSFNPSQLNSCHQPKDTRNIDDAISYFR